MWRSRRVAASVSLRSHAIHFLLLFFLLYRLLFRLRVFSPRRERPFMDLNQVVFSGAVRAQRIWSMARASFASVVQKRIFFFFLYRAFVVQKQIFSSSFFFFSFFLYGAYVVQNPLSFTIFSVISEVSLSDEELKERGGGLYYQEIHTQSALSVRVNIFQLSLNCTLPQLSMFFPSF